LSSTSNLSQMSVQEAHEDNEIAFIIRRRSPYKQIYYRTIGDILNRQQESIRLTHEMHDQFSTKAQTNSIEVSLVLLASDVCKSDACAIFFIAMGKGVQFDILKAGKLQRIYLQVRLIFNTVAMDKIPKNNVCGPCGFPAAGVTRKTFNAINVSWTNCERVI